MSTSTAAARGGFLLLAAVATAICVPDRVDAQSLEPRSFSPVPVSVNFAGVGYGYSFGNVLLDPAVPLEDGTGKVHSLLGAYVRTFSFFGMSAKADAIVPFAFGDWEGRLAGQDTSRSATGFGDPAVRLSVNFVGAPALEMPRFMAFRQGTVVGASLRVIAPLGQYDESKIINLGTNRWTFVPRVGVSQRLGRWNLEGVTAAWFFTDNPNNQGRTIEQDPLFAVQASVSYLFDGGAWVSANGGWGSGGRATVDGVPGNERQQNTRFGATATYPLTRRASVKLAWIGGVSTRLGADFDSFILVYQYRWGGGL
ncbi:MAG: transporter [marine benthic group bacterium]|nr:transporter [Candidatus Benthicola marisminoris]